jgi:hypothetical protein
VAAGRNPSGVQSLKPSSSMATGGGFALKEDHFYGIPLWNGAGGRRQPADLLPLGREPVNWQSVSTKSTKSISSRVSKVSPNGARSNVCGTCFVRAAFGPATSPQKNFKYLKLKRIYSNLQYIT